MLTTVLALVFLLAATSTALATTGGIKVDNDNTCADVDREDNTLGTGSAGSWIWLNIDPSNYTPPYFYQIFDNGDAVTGVIPITFTQCPSPNERYRWADFDQPDALGSYTLVVYQGTGANQTVVSKDSFRVVSDPNKTND
jgi:hypothetical protein